MSLFIRRSWLCDLSLLALVIGVFYFLWLGSYALITPDEGRYGEIARELFTTGNYLSPRLDGALFFDKPILMYWLVALSIKYWGVSEWSLRFCSALIGIFGCLINYIAGRYLFDRRTGILSAVILATTPLYYFNSHYLNMDLAVAVFISGALLSFIIAMQALNGHKKFFSLSLAYICVGLAVLTKGLIGIVFPIMIIGLWILLLNRWRLILQMHLISGLSLFFIICAPWYILLQRQHPQFFHYFFITQQFSRYMATNFNSPQPWWFYLPVVLLSFMPWSFFIVQAFRRDDDRQIQATRWFLLLWIVVVLVFFSIPHSKIITYINPIFPPLALLVGNYLSKQRVYKSTLVIICVSSTLLAIVLMVIPFLHLSIIPVLPKLIYFSMASLLLFGSGMCIYLIKRPNHLMIISSLLLFNAILLLLILRIIPSLSLFSSKPMATLLNTYLTANAQVATYHNYFTDLPIYLHRKVTVVAHWDDPAIFARDNWQRELGFGISWEPSLRERWFIGEDTFWQRWYSDQPWFAVVKPEDFSDFAQGAHYHVNVLGYDNNLIVITNQPILN